MEVLPLIEKRPDVDYKDHRKKYTPAREGTKAPAQALLIQEEPNADGADDLGKPVDEIIQCACPNTEYGTVVVVKLWRLCVREISSRCGN